MPSCTTAAPSGLRPGDARVRHNLAVARAQAIDRIDESTSRTVLETVAFWHRGLRLDAKAWTAGGAWLLGWLSLTLVVLARRPPRPLRAAGLGLLAVAVLVGISAVVEVRELNDPAAAVVVAPEVPLRSGDGASYPARYENPLHAGAEVHVTRRTAGWVEIRLRDGKGGWLPDTSVEPVVPAPD